MEQSVPKCRYIKFRRQGINQKKERNSVQHVQNCISNVWPCSILLKKHFVWITPHSCLVNSEYSSHPEMPHNVRSLHYPLRDTGSTAKNSGQSTSNFRLHWMKWRFFIEVWIFFSPYFTLLLNDSIRIRMALICKSNVAQNTRIPLSEFSTWINFAVIIHRWKTCIL